MEEEISSGESCAKSSIIALCLTGILTLISVQFYVWYSSGKRDGFYSPLGRRLDLLSQRQEFLINIKEYEDLDTGECFYSTGSGGLHKMECR